MQINSISNHSFGTKPDANTKYLLFQLEDNYIDTKPITDLMNKTYVKTTLSTQVLGDGSLRMDIYHKGDKMKSILGHDDTIYVDPGTFKLKNPHYFHSKLLSALRSARDGRSPKQAIWDKINYNLTDRNNA